MKILRAADGSAYTRRMLAYVAAHDEWLGSRHRYTVLHCVSPLPHRAAAFESVEVIRRFYDDDAESVLRPIREFFKSQGIEATFTHEVGPAAEHIAKLAALGRFDLLVLGSHGHEALANVVLGSVATKVLALCTTPVLLIRGDRLAAAEAGVASPD
jgi:nucleotide-binding universal stress UspA family protein